MAIKKHSLDDVDPYLNVLFVADPGVGKTTAAMTVAKLPAEGKIIVLDSDGLLTARALREVGIPTDRIEPFTIDTFDDLRTLGLQFKKRLAAEPGCVAAIIVDTLSELNNKLVGNTALARATRTGNMDKQFEIKVEERGEVVEQLRWFCRLVRELPCHTIMTAHIKEDKEADGTVYYRPAFGPKFTTDIYKFNHAVVLMDTEVVDGKIVRVGYTKPMGKYRGKDNLNCLPMKMAEPTFERIYQVVQGELTTEEVDATVQAHTEA